MAKRKIKDKILTLRAEGKTYKQIAETLDCDLSTICYHCGAGRKEKVLKIRRRDFLKSTRNQVQNKIFEFCITKKSQVSKTIISKINQIKKNKISSFFNKSNKMKNVVYNKPNFNYEDIINKFGEKTNCYLTGEEIDLNLPRTYQFDHIIPRSRGGENSLDNLGICTREANQAKNDMTPDEFFNLCKRILETQGYEVKRKISESN